MTLEEFLKATEKKEFLEPDSWEVIEPTLYEMYVQQILRQSIVPLTFIPHYVCMYSLTILGFLYECHYKIMNLISWKACSNLFLVYNHIKLEVF